MNHGIRLQIYLRKAGLIVFNYFLGGLELLFGEKEQLSPVRKSLLDLSKRLFYVRCVDEKWFKRIFLMVL